MKGTWCVCLAVLLGAMAGPSVCYAQPGNVPSYFPMTPGTVWVYRGVTRWGDPAAASGVRQETVTWKMRVLRVIHREGVQAAVVKGYPQDLIWFDPSQGPGSYLLVRKGEDFYLLTGDRMTEVMRRLENPRDRLDHLLHDDDLILQAPLALHKAFGEQDQIGRKDQSYFWLVENASPVKVPDSPGLSVEVGRMRYQLMFRTAPDETRVDFIPGVGITRYRYVHHGSVAETDVRLIRYIPGATAVPSQKGDNAS